MVRPKTILWVDDEVEGLAAHRRFLEDQGFTVAAAAHGDDALALLRRQAYSIVLLDEQMPGRRGLELIGEIRALDPAMPVVMVTQSEDEGTLREAIGIEVDDYLDPDRLAQRAFVLALRDHHHGHGGVERADLADQLEAASAGHLLVQQDDAVGLAPQQRERVVAVGRGGHREPLVLQKAPVRGESLDFVIHPEDGLRPHHQSKLMATGEAGQRRTYFATCCAFSWSASAPSATSC